MLLTSLTTLSYETLSTAYFRHLKQARKIENFQQFQLSLGRCFIVFDHSKVARNVFFNKCWAHIKGGLTLFDTETVCFALVKYCIFMNVKTVQIS